MRFTDWCRLRLLSAAVAAAAPALLSAACCCGTPCGAADTAPAAAEAAPVKPYPLNTCIVSGDAVDSEPGETITKVYDGREIKFCCKDCVPKYEKEPAKYNAKLDAAEMAPPANDQSAKPAEPLPKADQGEHAAHHE